MFFLTCSAEFECFPSHGRTEPDITCTTENQRPVTSVWPCEVMWAVAYSPLLRRQLPQWCPRVRGCPSSDAAAPPYSAPGGSGWPNRTHMLTSVIEWPHATRRDPVHFGRLLSNTGLRRAGAQLEDRCIEAQGRSPRQGKSDMPAGGACERRAGARSLEREPIHPMC